MNSNRIMISEVDPDAYKAMYALEKYLASTQLAPIHKVLIQIRASLINGCAFCIDAHTKDARKLKVADQRIYSLSVWRETDFYTEEERVILELTEEVTLISTGVSDNTYNKAATVLNEKYLAAVIMAAIAINAWNRIGITTRMMPKADQLPGTFL